MAFDTSLICGGIPAGALHKSEHKSKSSHSSDLGFFCALEFLVAIFIASRKETQFMMNRPLTIENGRR
jgi:hypothetical protein